MQDEHIQMILSSALLQPAAEPHRIRAALLAADPDEAAGIIVRHKVSHIAQDRIEHLASDGSGSDDGRLRAIGTAIARLRAPLEERLASADHLLNDLSAALPGVPVLQMKGLAARDWYPAPLRRDVGDADLWTPDIDSGWALAGALRERGYEYESGELPWVKGDLDGHLFGQIRLVDPNRMRISVDIHIGPYSVRYCGMLRFVMSAAIEPWRLLAQEDNLCAVIVNAAGDCFIDAKTINDTVLALSEPLNLDYISERVAEAELTEFLAALLDVVDATCALRPEQHDALAVLRGTGPAERLGLSVATDAATRVELVVAHARRAALRLTGRASTADEIAADARNAYTNDKQYRLVRDRAGRGELPALNPWTCIRLAPQPLLRHAFKRTAADQYPARAVTSLARELELVHGPSGDLVRFRTDAFVPTTDYSFPVGLVDGVAPAGAAGASRANAGPADAVDRLLSSILGKAFVSEVLGRRHHLFRGGADRFAEFLRWEDLNTILGCHRLRSPQLRLVRGGDVCPEASYLQTESGRRGRITVRPDPEKVQAALADGYTLALRYADELHPPLAALASGYERLLDAEFEFNVYASWSLTEGFGAHWDDHDVFVHQLAGAKRWRIFGRTERSLMPRSVSREAAPTEPIDDVVLGPGDLLHLPRGYWHAPVSVEAPSLHLTGSLPSATGAHLASWLLQELQTRPALCEDIPRFAGPADRAAYLDRLRAEVVAALAAPDVLTRYLAAADAARRQRPRFTLPDVATIR